MTLELNIKAKRYIKSPHVDELKELMQIQEYQNAKMQATIAAIQAHKNMYITKVKTMYLNPNDFDIQW
jgi:flagellar basal body rod protein FlgC